MEILKAAKVHDHISLPILTSKPLHAFIHHTAALAEWIIVGMSQKEDGRVCMKSCESGIEYHSYSFLDLKSRRKKPRRLCFTVRIQTIPI